MSETRFKVRWDVVPPHDLAFAEWRNRITHPTAVHTSERSHRELCVGGWIPSGSWWLHCGVCRPKKKDVALCEVKK